MARRPLSPEHEAIRWLGATLLAIPVGLSSIRMVSLVFDRDISLDTEGVFTFGGAIAGGITGYIAGRKSHGD